MEVSNQASSNGLPTRGLVTRQSGGGVTVATSVLPIGAIIGIAIVGSALLFGVLTITIMHNLRSRYKLKNESRDLDLSDDNEEDILDALASSRLPERGLKTQIQPRPLNLGPESLPKEWTEIPLYGTRLDKSKLMPPAYAFEITGLRDSWPLVGWVESSSTGPLSANRLPVISSGNGDRRTSCSAFPLSMDSELSWPQPSLSSSGSYSQGRDCRPIQWSGHSAKSSVTSLKRLSSTRKSVSDNQLTSILRSTSQRLREARRRPLSRSLSVMSQVSGAPPTIQPPSPPGDQRGEIREALVNADDVSLIDSVRSSVLNAISQTPSPQTRSSHTADNNGREEKGASPVSSGKSESDSLCPSKTPDLFIPAALTSPSKPGAGTDQRFEMRISSTARLSTTLFQDDMHSLLTGDGKGMIYDNLSSNQIDPNYDPFVSSNPRAIVESRSKSIKGPRPLIRRQTILEQNLSSKDPETANSPLRTISGNQKSPMKPRLASAEPSKLTQENPFQWSPQRSPSLLLSPGPKPTGIKPKGHRRRRTVRLSHLTRPACVGVVLEEPENGSTPPRMNDSPETQNLPASSSVEPENTLADPNPSRISSTRPPSIPIFQPFLAVPSMVKPSDSKLPSDGSYSATMSFYDYYSDGSANTSDQLAIPKPSHSPTPSTKKSRRRGYNFFDATYARDIALLESTTTSLDNDRRASPHKFAQSQFPGINISDDAPAVPIFTSDLSKPTSPQPPAVNDSIAASVSLLRRMNSDVSTYSTGSFLSDQSNGSPAIPGIRGSGLSHIKRGSGGTMNYLSIGVETPSPTGRRSRTRASVISGKSRDYHQSLVLGDGLERYDALGLVMPILEDSPHKLPSPEPLKNVSSQTDWPPIPPDWPSTSSKWPSPAPRSKVPAAQLRPMSNTPLSQENCHSCNRALSPLRLNPRDSTLASRYHDSCFKCSTCHQALGTAFAIDKKPYCKQHYYEKVNGICDVAPNPENMMERGYSGDRWSEVMTTPLKKIVRRESQMEMPSPHDGSPKSMVQWRGSLGLYDEMGFLKSSPERSHGMDSFGLGPADDLLMGT